MPITFTFNPANNVGKVRTLIQDTSVGTLLNGVITSTINGNVLTFSGKNFTTNDLIGEMIYPNTACAFSYKITANNTSAISIRGDVTGMASAGVSAVINQAMFSDTEINTFLSIASQNTLQAASVGLRAIAASQALLAKKFDKKGIGGLTIEKRELKQIIDLAESYEKQSKSIPSSSVNSFEFGAGMRSDEFETDNIDEFGDDLNEYNQA